jgi:hypothetical protein
MRAAYRAYMCVYCVGLAILVIALAGANVAVDPYLVFASVSLNSLSLHRGGTKPYKAEMVRRQAHGALLLGSSRTEIGIDPLSAEWGSAAVLDASLAGTNLWQTREVLSLALSHGAPTQVLLFADFLMFNGHRTTDGEFVRSRFNPDLNPYSYVVDNLLGVQTLKASAQVLARRVSQSRSPTAARARVRPRSPTSRTSEVRSRFETVLRRFRRSSDLYGGMDYPNDRVEMLRAMVSLCQETETPFTVVIPPIHALQLVTLDAMGLWPSFERWKRDVAEIASAAEEVRLWDFAYCHALAAEAVPAQGDATTRMEWWIESSHFRPELGDVVLRRVLRRPEAGHAKYGVELTSDNVRSRLVRMRQSLDAYVATHPDESSWAGGIR